MRPLHAEYGYMWLKAFTIAVVVVAGGWIAVYLTALVAKWL